MARCDLKGNIVKFRHKGVGHTRVYCARYKDPIGVPPSFSVPKPLQSTIARVLHNRYTANKFDVHADQCLELSAPEGSQFVAWKLEAGERVFFIYDYLAAWTSKVTFKTRIYLQLAGLALGKVFYHAAIGPGSLLFEVRGQPTICDSEGTQGTLDFTRIVAWSSTIDFELAGSHKMIDIYMNPLHVQQVTPGLILIDADDRSVHNKGLMRRVLRKAYLPG